MRYWGFRSHGHTLAELPTNHHPRFAPILHPTLETGVETLVVAGGAWLT